MKLLIYGHRGWIGGQVISHLEEQSSDSRIEWLKGESRLEDIPSVILELDSVRPTHVLCLIGRTHGTIGDKVYATIDYLEQKGKLVENIRDNLFCPVSLAILCQSRGIHLTYLGTGCIFTYDEAHPDSTVPFKESDLPNFFESGYSVVKGFTDQLMHLLPVCNARIRMPITSDMGPRNFITKIVNYEKICSMENSMSVLDDLIPILIELSRRKYVGTINLVNPGAISHDEILGMYRDIVDPKFVWKNFTYEEQIKILAAGRSNNTLDTNILQEMFPEILDIRSSVERTLRRMTIKND